MKKIIIVVIVLTLLGALVIVLKSLDRENQETLVIGGDKDPRGCLIGAGYSWCEAKDKCLRVWEEYCTAAPPKVAVFNCAGGKTVTATFYPGDDKYVDLDLGDDRRMTIPRALSASGARYAKSDESFIFWNKDNTATIWENNAIIFDNCVTS